MKNIMLKYAVILIFLLLPLPARATVFRCETQAGKISYQQLPCADTQGSQTVLPNVGYNLRAGTDIFRSQTPTTYSSTRIEKTTQKRKKKTRRHKKTAAELEKIAQDKAFKRELRCNSVHLKIQLLHNRLRAGYTAKQELRINEQLLHYAQLQEKYCS